MPLIHSCLTSHRARRALVGLVSTAVLAMIVAQPVPAHAADARGVQMRVSPAYPVLAKRMKITGSVKVQATVDANGKVIDVKAISGNSILMPAAEDAVRRWIFDPGAGKATVDVEVTFALSTE